ncbi:MAG: GAF domain-containing protein [Acidobacteriia bacterium]|nr:GAF domain-containing protein [Terriglobia bacterium]
MVQRPTGRLNRFGLALAAAWLCGAAHAQVRLTLEQVNTRKTPDYSPAYAGQRVVVQGVVSARPFHFPGYTVLAFEQDRHGGVIEVPESDHLVDNYRPGDAIEVEGLVSSRAGMVMILPAQIRHLGNQQAPSPEAVSIAGLLGFRHLAQLIRTEGQVVEVGDTTAGAYLLISAKDRNYKLFFPHSSGEQSRMPAGFAPGDAVGVRGVAFQYCPTAPYDRWFELLVSNPSDLVLTQRSRALPPLVVAGSLAAVLLIGLVLWSRERRLRGQRERLRKTYQLGEEILSASSLETILEQIATAMPNILGVTGVHLYVFNRGTKALDAVVSGGLPPLSISLSSPPGGTQAGAVACFHYRTLLVIPDVERSPFPIASSAGTRSPKSLLFVPMLSQGEVGGVLELDQDNRARDFTPDEQALAQHLGNQIGVAIRLLDQRSVQEQLFRTEKLAAVGRLITGVVNELQAPLASISELAGRAVEKSQASMPDRELSAIAAESQKASAIVARLVSFAAAEQVEARPVCVSTLLRNLIEFREHDWKASGIRVQNLTMRDPLFVLGSHGQLEQAFLTLLVHAEQSLAQAEQKTLTIRTSVLAKRLLVEVSFTAPPDARTPQETAAVLGVTRGVITGHGGEVRLIEKNNAEPCFEVELPVTARERMVTVAPAAATPRDASHRMTALVIEPEDSAQRQLLGLLSTRGFRVVPVDNADTGLELAQRMRFDAAFCSVHAPGLNWVELSERMQSRVGGFILLSDGYNAELSADFEGDGRFVVPKPVQEADLERVLGAMESPPVPARHPVA